MSTGRAVVQYENNNCSGHEQLPFWLPYSWYKAKKLKHDGTKPDGAQALMHIADEEVEN